MVLFNLKINSVVHFFSGSSIKICILGFGWHKMAMINELFFSVFSYNSGLNIASVLPQILIDIYAYLVHSWIWMFQYSVSKLCIKLDGKHWHWKFQLQLLSACLTLNWGVLPNVVIIIVYTHLLCILFWFMICLYFKKTSAGSTYNNYEHNQKNKETLSNNKRFKNGFKTMK